MSEIFESRFHRWYVGGEGEVVEKPLVEKPVREVRRITLEQVLAEYRKYVGDPNAELPEEILKTFLANNRTENDRKT